MSSRFSLWTRLAFRVFNQFKQNEAQLHQLRYLFWESTLRCNLNCRHCGSDCKTDLIQKDMPLEVFLQAAQAISNQMDASQVTVVITGGEPLLRSDLEVCGKALRKMGFRWGIVSNGMAYTSERHASLLRCGMGALTISLDGLADQHNQLRNHPHSFERALAAIRLAAAVPRLNFDVVTCVHPGNIDQLEALRDVLIEAGVKHWRLFTIAPMGRAIQNDYLSPNAVMMQQLMRFIDAQQTNGQIQVQFSCEGFVGAYEKRVRDGLFFCRAGIHIGSILNDGSISACPNIDRKFAQGSIYETDFISVWNSKFQTMRDRSWMKCGICTECEDFNYCGGSGFHLRDGQTGEVKLCHAKLVSNSK